MTLNKVTGTQITYYIFIYLVLFFVAAISIFPFVWIITTSLKVNASLFDFPPKLIPNPVKWINYYEIFDGTGMARSFMNSIFISVINVFGVLFFCSIAAYGFAKIRFKGRNFLFLLLLSTMMIPIQVTLIPLYIVFRYLNWINTYMPLTVPIILANAYGVFLTAIFHKD